MMRGEFTRNLHDYKMKKLEHGNAKELSSDGVM